MLIDPFTVIAQIVNFALLVWLLRRFLYGPVTRAMETREARVREEVDGARRLRAEAEAEGERYRGLVAAFTAEREARLSEMNAEIDALRQEQMREVRAGVKELRGRWNQTLEQEKESFLQGLRLQIGQESLAVIRRALKELADDDLEDRLVKRFVERLRAMGAEDRERVSAAIQNGGETFHLRSAFPLSGAHRAAIIEAVAETFDVESSPQFETNPDLVAGVELRVGWVKVAWTLDHYLHDLEEAMRDAFHQTAKTGGADGDG